MAHVIKVFTGDTKKFTSVITAYDGVTLVDPDNNDVTVTIYNSDSNAPIHTTPATRQSEGVYECEYEFPDIAGSYLVEFSGNFGGAVHLGRIKIRARMRM